MAIVKGYIGVGILGSAKAFSNGGWCFSLIVLIICGALTSICSLKLIKVGLKLHCFSYSQIVKRTLGKKGGHMLDFMISLSQLSFCIAQMTFFLSTSRDLSMAYLGDGKTDLEEHNATDSPVFGDFHNLWTYGVWFLVICYVLTLVRNIALFSFTFILGNVLLLLTVITICLFSGARMASRGLGDNLVAVNSDNTALMWKMVGYSIFAFEGIGVLMPIMQASEHPE